MQIFMLEFELRNYYMVQKLYGTSESLCDGKFRPISAIERLWSIVKLFFDVFLCCLSVF